MNYGTRKLYDQHGNLICWFSSGSGATGFTWYQTEALSCGTQPYPVIDCRAANGVWVLNDFADLTSIDVENRILYDANGYAVANWSAGNHFFAGKTKVTAISDANYNALATDQLIAYRSLTATRTVTLLSPSSVQMDLIIKDESGSAGSTNYITIAPPSGVTIDGFSVLTIKNAMGVVRLYVDNGNYFTW